MRKHILVQDTREQKPLAFHKLDIRVKVRKLDCGDYGFRFMDGNMSSTFFERKSLHDLFGSLTSGYARFKREIIRAQVSKRRIVIIIEGGMTRVLEGVRYSKAQGLSIVKTLFTLKVKYGVDFVFLQDRREASEYIVQHYYAEWKLKNSGGR